MERVAAEPLDERAKVQWYSERLVFEGNQAAVSADPSYQRSSYLILGGATMVGNGREQDVDFSNPTRKVIHAGPLLRQNDPLKRSVNVWKELWVVLFDNYRTSSYACSSRIPNPTMVRTVVMAKPKGKGDNLKYVLWKSVSTQPRLWCPPHPA